MHSEHKINLNNSFNPQSSLKVSLNLDYKKYLQCVYEFQDYNPAISKDFYTGDTFMKHAKTQITSIKLLSVVILYHPSPLAISFLLWFMQDNKSTKNIYWKTKKKAKNVP